MVGMNKYVRFFVWFTAFIMLFSVKAYAASVSRLQGDTRYETSIEISKEGWEQSENVVITTGKRFPDALCAAPLASKLKAPILLVDGGTVSESLLQELSRLKVKHAYLIGGTSAISVEIENTLAGMGLEVIRISGIDRYETSIKIAEELGQVNQAVIATGADYPDALSIAPIAAKNTIPILLTAKSQLPGEVLAYLQKQQMEKCFVIGGQAVINDQVLNKIPTATRIGGINRYDTNVQVIRQFENEVDFTSTYLATGQDYPDALSGSALAANTGSPIILTSSNLDEATVKLITSQFSKINEIRVLGGYNAVPSQVTQQLLSLKRFKIVIDPGHGGYDTGAIGPSGIQEKNVTLKVALKLGKALEAQGLEVVYTRTSDEVSWQSSELEDLQARCDIAAKEKADLFICIHANSYGDPSAHGIETYYSDGDAKSTALAQDIQDALVKELGLTNRGVKTAGYYVLRHNSATSILTELAFISNPQEEQLLNTDSFQNECADALMKGILKYLGL